MGVNDQHWVCISVNCIMVAVFNPNMVRYHQSMIHQHLEAHSPLTEGHHPPLAGGPPLPTHRGYHSLCRGGGLCVRCADTNFPRVSNLPTHPPLPFDTLVTGMGEGGVWSNWQVANGYQSWVTQIWRSDCNVLSQTRPMPLPQFDR